MRYLITGKNGQLARAFVKRLEADGIDYAAPDETRLDVTNERAVEEAVYSFKPRVIINCAAYNLVDRAEQEPDAADRVNGTGPGILAAAAQKHGALLVHYGTDYVFDGAKENGLYTEDDGTNPLSRYGKSKLMGEHRTMQETDDFLIFRLSWVFGEGKQNFIARLTEWAKAGEYLKIACDEFSVPTSTETAVDVTLRAVRQGLTGLYHLTSRGFCSRYEWAKAALSAMGIEKFIRPVSMDSFHLPAKRPKFSAMSSERISRLLGLSLPGWEEAVRKFIAEGKPAS